MTCDDYKALVTNQGLGTKAELASCFRHTMECPDCLRWFSDLAEVCAGIASKQSVDNAEKVASRLTREIIDDSEAAKVVEDTEAPDNITEYFPFRE